MSEQSNTVVVTGAAGFIGSHLVDELLRRGHRVVGLDDLDPWYSPAAKRRNLETAMGCSRFHLRTEPITATLLAEVLPGAAGLFHLAGRPGVQTSWGRGFAECSRRNVELTQTVLEAALAAGTPSVVAASSSSVYGQPRGPRPSGPMSPYGITKLATEQLARVYADIGVPVTSLRYFTVYGPRQRPDMALHRLFEATRPDGAPFVRRGDGRQRREMTYVADVVDATIAAWHHVPGGTLDVGGGCSVTLNELIDRVEDLTGRRVDVRPAAPAPGDPSTTVADLGPTLVALGWRPRTSLADGLAAQHRWHDHREANAPAASLPPVTAA